MKKLSMILIAASMVGALAAGVASGGYDDPPTDPNAGDGEWVVTSYSASAQNTCDASKGEICKEWCVVMPSSNVRPTGTLCCVVGQTCIKSR